MHNLNPLSEIQSHNYYAFEIQFLCHWHAHVNIIAKQGIPSQEMIWNLHSTRSLLYSNKAGSIIIQIIYRGSYCFIAVQNTALKVSG